MSDEKQYTEREVIARERAAVERTVSAVWPYMNATVGLQANGPLVAEWIGSKALAARLYPLPKVERPRVVQDPMSAFREWCAMESLGKYVIHTRETYRGAPAVWTTAIGDSSAHVLVTPERVALWADLLANPTELVEADA